MSHLDPDRPSQDVSTTTQSSTQTLSNPIASSSSNPYHTPNTTPSSSASTLSYPIKPSAEQPHSTHSSEVQSQRTIHETHDKRTSRPASGVIAAKLEAMTPDERVAWEAAEKQRVSFERSLAGPSVGKAGLMRDQTEINHIIAEASKGSKFYLLQVKKDQELNEKIAWFQAKCDELMRESSRAQLEAEAERIILEVETSRDLTQTIVHVDMDMFYAAVEIQRDPSLKGKAFGVSGGVLTTASYEARKYGVRSGMAGFIAKKLCPHIILTDLHFDLYGEASNKVKAVLKTFDENMAMAGLDEGYLNITNYMQEHDMTASEVVAQLRAEVEAASGLTCSAGIAPNKMLAKICSDKNKPNGQFELEFEPGVIRRFMHDMPVRKIPGFGRVTERCLEGLGVEVCGDVYTKRAELMAMDHWFGFRGLCKSYLGIASNVVEPGRRDERKSVGYERTFADKYRDQDIIDMLEHCAEELEKDLEATQYSGKTVTVVYKHHTYERRSRARTMPKYLNKKEDIFPVALDLLKKELPLRLRLLGIRVSNLKDLTAPEDKGILNYFTTSKKEATPAALRDSGGEDLVDLTMLNDDAADEEEVLDEDDFRPPTQEGAPGTESSSTLSSDIGPAESSRNPSGSVPSRRASRQPHSRSTSAEPHAQAPDVPVCCICNKALPGQTEFEINQHIDLCLNGGLIKGLSPTGSPSRKRAAAAEAQGGSGSRRGKKSRGKDSSSGAMMAWLKGG